ncbi:MAG: hypothetical protein DMG24_20235 [Acidobacteria bacterium]|nr:MAG: hypothetical protein DMG24_20235 [Acidobacteriota bacterium]
MTGNDQDSPDQFGMNFLGTRAAVLFRLARIPEVENDGIKMLTGNLGEPLDAISASRAESVSRSLLIFTRSSRIRTLLWRGALTQVPLRREHSAPIETHPDSPQGILTTRRLPVKLFQH